MKTGMVLIKCPYRECGRIEPYGWEQINKEGEVECLWCSRIINLKKNKCIIKEKNG